MAALLEIGFHRHDDRGAKCDQIAGANVTERMSVVGLVLLRAMVAQADFVLIVEPGLIVFRARGVDHPLPEALCHGLGIVAIDFMGFRILIIGAQMRMIEDDPAPRLEQVVDLIAQHLFREAEIEHVLFRKERRFLELLPFIRGDRRLRDLIGSKIIAWDFLLLAGSAQGAYSFFMPTLRTSAVALEYRQNYPF